MSDSEEQVLMRKIIDGPTRARVKGDNAFWFGVCGVLVGLWFGLSAVGIFGFLVGEGAKPWVLWFLAFTFVCPGIGGIMMGRQSILDKMNRETGDNPCLKDYAWTREGIGDETSAVFKGFIAKVLIGMSMIVPFNMVWLAQPSGFGAIMYLATVIFDGVLIWACVREYLKITQLKWFGKARLSFKSFPFRLGESVDVGFSCEKGIVSYSRISFTLRFVEECYERELEGRPGSAINQPINAVNRYKLWETTQKVDGPAGLKPDEKLNVSIATPNEARLTTDWRNWPPNYWELVTTIKTKGKDAVYTFVVPIY